MVPVDSSNAFSTVSPADSLDTIVDQLKKGEVSTIFGRQKPLGEMLLWQAVERRNLEAVLWLVNAGLYPDDLITEGALLMQVLKQQHVLLTQLFLCLATREALETIEPLLRSHQLIRDLPVFKAIWYWAVTHFLPVYGPALMKLLHQNIIVDEPMAAVEEEKKATDLHQPLLSQAAAHYLLSQVAIKDVQSELLALRQLAHNNGQKMVADFLQSLMSDTRALPYSQLAFLLDSMQANYRTIFRSVLTDEPMDQAKFIYNHQLDLLNQEIATLLQHLNHEIAHQPLSYLSNYYRLDRGTKVGLWLFMLAWAVFIPCVAEIAQLADDRHQLVSTMAETPLRLDSSLYCSQLLDSRFPIRCREAATTSLCQSLCQSLGDIEHKIFWLFLVGVAFPGVGTLCLLPLVLMALSQLSAKPAQDLNRCNHLPLKHFSQELQQQATELFAKTQAMIEKPMVTLTVNASVQETRDFLKQLTERIKSFRQPTHGLSFASSSWTNPLMASSFQKLTEIPRDAKTTAQEQKN